MLKRMSQAASAAKSPFFAPRGRVKDIFLRRFAEVVTCLSVAGLLALLIPLSGRSPKSSPNSAPSPRTVDATMIEVLDGDTLLVRIDNRVEKVRLIGIDAPEAVADEKALNDSDRSNQDVRSIVKLGHLASQHTRSLVTPGTLLHIVFDRQRTDRFDRLLGYVFLPDNSLLNERIVADGFATIRNYHPNMKFEERLDKAFQSAKAEQRGLWKRKDHRVLEVIAD